MGAETERTIVVRVTQYQGAAAINAKRAAEFLGISLEHFRQQTQAGVFPPGRKIGSSRLWRVDDLLRAFDRLPTA